MRHFIDESGSFSWHNPGVSLFVGLLLPDRSSAAVFDRFIRWKRETIGRSHRELKGAELTANQLDSFSCKVLPFSDRDPKLTVVGADTRNVSRGLLEQVRKQVGDQFEYSGKFVLKHNPSNTRLAQQYTELAGWVRNRSIENFLWLNVLEEEILQSVQHGVAYFLEPEDDPEFESIEIVIDRSFVRRQQHISFWKELLRNGLVNRSNRGGFVIPDTWPKRDQPFMRKYRKDGIFQFNDLYQKHMRFDDSEAVLGLQVADICAHICYRHYRTDRNLKAYRNLYPRIVGEGGRAMTIVQFTEASLYKDSVENHVRLLDVEEMKRRAAERRKQKLSLSPPPNGVP